MLESKLWVCHIFDAVKAISLEFYIVYQKEKKKKPEFYIQNECRQRGNMWLVWFGMFLSILSFCFALPPFWNLYLFIIFLVRKPFGNLFQLSLALLILCGTFFFMSCRWCKRCGSLSTMHRTGVWKNNTHKMDTTQRQVSFSFWAAKHSRQLTLNGLHVSGVGRVVVRLGYDLKMGVFCFRPNLVLWGREAIGHLVAQKCRLILSCPKATKQKV